ncbi:DNA methylase N-4/N-6 domain protein, partial [Helicobacter felis ATCC 49179]
TLVSSAHYGFNALKRVFMRVLVVVLGVFCLGCTPRVVYKDVYIPTKCQIVRPARPS